LKGILAALQSLHITNKLGERAIKEKTGVYFNEQTDQTLINALIFLKAAGFKV
jgi:hypothetical protein